MFKRINLNMYPNNACTYKQNLIIHTWRVASRGLMGLHSSTFKFSLISNISCWKIETVILHMQYYTLKVNMIKYRLTRGPRATLLTKETTSLSQAMIIQVDWLKVKTEIKDRQRTTESQKGSSELSALLNWKTVRKLNFYEYSETCLIWHYIKKEKFSVGNKQGVKLNSATYIGNEYRCTCMTRIEEKHFLAIIGYHRYTQEGKVNTST